MELLPYFFRGRALTHSSGLGELRLGTLFRWRESMTDASRPSTQVPQAFSYAAEPGAPGRRRRQRSLGCLRRSRLGLPQAMTPRRSSAGHHQVTTRGLLLRRCIKELHFTQNGDIYNMARFLYLPYGHLSQVPEQPPRNMYGY